ncbi:alpha/beta fold hydrolase [Thalassovita sp.]|jgi:lysophospholipase|uniref:alpha/beta fold hydrolase n=1 Tax=Thalassovita sp. TaxID=1979401 RepID=UPI003B5A5765
MTPAPFLTDICDIAPDGAAYWLETSDGPRVRAVLWGQEAEKGTVFLFPGRTEYAEKYAHTAAALQQGGYATFAMDWRGQGLADRLLDDPLIGHVDKFTDYQNDVRAMVRAAQELELPKPYFLIAHSMGGAIGLRAVMEGLTVNACVFTGPMWGITLHPAARPAAWAISWASRVMGAANNPVPGSRMQAYVLAEPFKGNTLTTDPGMYSFMQEQLLAQPELSLGGPSLNWVHEALSETLELSRRPAPNLPCLTFLGTNERIVDPKRIQTRMASWPGGELIMVENGEHEVLMETPQMREASMARILELFDSTRMAAPPKVAC